jgi:hypothetical protein
MFFAFNENLPKLAYDIFKVSGKKRWKGALNHRNVINCTVNRQFIPSVLKVCIWNVQWKILYALNIIKHHIVVAVPKCRKPVFEHYEKCSNTIYKPKGCHLFQFMLSKVYKWIIL